MTPAAYIELNRQALRNNVNKAREYAPNTKILAVVKANAYGHGLLLVANCLVGHVDAFAVARVDEAVRLREAGISERILVLQGFSGLDELELMQSKQIEAVVHSVTQVELLESTDLIGAISVWVKIDTGMSRLGFAPEQFADAAQRLQRCKNVQADISFMTHFANADDPEDDMTLKQLHVFQQSTGQYKAEKSSANSAAIVAWPETHQDWVRPGLMLYGVSPMLKQTAIELELQPVMSFFSRIIAIKQLKKGDAVGYGGSWVADKDCLLGVVSIGYGDGYPRYAKQGTPVLIKGQRAPLIGRVSMDMITVDLSNLNNVKPGDSVLLWGKELPVEEIASCSDTIPYTLLCGITARVQVLLTGKKSFN